LETHHVIPLSSQGDDDPKNMIALCANDHRQAHYSVNNELMRQAFLAIIKSKQ
jgi:5-methylcytosine-specific restriction protein A